jgi:hypothetical protein
MAQDFDSTEFYVTNEARVFGGNAIDLMTALYKSEVLPVRVRLYAASKAYEFEGLSSKSIGEIPEGDSEESYRRVQDLMKEYVRHAIRETRARIAGQARGAGAPSWVQSLVQEELARPQFVPEPEVAPPGPEPPKRKPRASVVDGESAQQACDTEEKPEQSQPHKKRYADIKSATRDSPPQPERANVEPTATEMVPTRGMNGRIRWIPR